MYDTCNETEQKVKINTFTFMVPNVLTFLACKDRQK